MTPKHFINRITERVEHTAWYSVFVFTDGTAARRHRRTNLKGRSEAMIEEARQIDKW